MAYVAYGITIAFFAWIGYDAAELIVGSIKDKKNGKG